MAAARDSLAAALADPSAAAASGNELFAVTELLDREPGLRRALSDPASAASARTGLAGVLLADRVSPATLDVVTTLVTQRWSAPADLPDAAEPEQLVLQVVELALAVRRGTICQHSQLLGRIRQVALG